MAPFAFTMDISRRDNGPGCQTIGPNDLVISRTTFIAALTVCVAVMCISLLGLVALGYREWDRSRQNKIARSQGRNSIYRHRISMMRKEVDDSFTRKYSGCMLHQPENPYLVSKDPVELMSAETVYEVPALQIKEETRSQNRKSKVSLFFDHTRGLWFSRH